MSEIQAVVDALESYEGILLDKGPVEGTLVAVGFNADDLATLSDDPQQFHIFGLHSRPEVKDFIHTLEEKWFPPETKLNDVFHFRLYRWGPTLWVIVSVPILAELTCIQVARECGVRLCDVCPVCFPVSENTPERFIVQPHLPNIESPPGERFPLVGINVRYIQRG